MSEQAFLWAIHAERGWIDDKALGDLWLHLRTRCAELDHGIMPDHERASARWHANPGEGYMWSSPFWLHQERQMAEAKFAMVHAEIKARLGAEERRMGPYLGGANRDEWSDVGWRYHYSICMAIRPPDYAGHRPVPDEELDMDDCCIDQQRCNHLHEQWRRRMAERYPEG